MESTIWEKIIIHFWDILSWFILTLMGLLTWIWRRQETEVQSMKKDIMEIREHVASKDDLLDEADRIRKEVGEEHSKIFNAVKDMQATLRADMQNSNQNVMTEIRDIRGFLMNHLERRGTSRIDDK